jgi:arylsulfatase A-like enzyme
MSLRSTLLLAASLISGAACNGPAPDESLGVVWIVLDAAGARYFGVYGNEIATTPNIDAFARGGATVFERAYSQSAWTPASTASFLTGRYPHPLIQTRGVGALARGQSIAGVLREAGFDTAGFSENPFVTSTFGFDDGFGEFHEYFPHRVLREKHLEYERVDSETTISEAIAWLEGQKAGRFFLYVHLLPPHVPYNAPEPFGGRFDPDYRGEIEGRPATLVSIRNGRIEASDRDIEHLRLQYQENLAFADQQVGRLLDALSALDRFDDSLVIVAADHGEAFNEHGFVLHGHHVFEEVIHVPLLIRLPGSRPQPPSWRGVVELRQLVPTICAVARISDCPGEARSLTSILEGDEPGSEVALSFSAAGRQPIAAVVVPDHKLVVDPRSLRPRALFHLESDPGERRNLRGARPDVVKELRDAMAGREGDPVRIERKPIEEEVQQRLRALGYVD